MHTKCIVVGLGLGLDSHRNTLIINIKLGVYIRVIFSTYQGLIAL